MTSPRRCPRVHDWAAAVSDAVAAADVASGRRLEGGDPAISIDQTQTFTTRCIHLQSFHGASLVVLVYAENAHENAALRLPSCWVCRNFNAGGGGAQASIEESTKLPF
jgi:hypothetical protein